MTITHAAQAVLASRPRKPLVLAIGDERFGRRLGEHLPDARVRSVQAADETDGYGADLIVVVGRYPLSTLADILVHPSLSHLSVVLVAPGRDIDRRGWGDHHVHVVLDNQDPMTAAAEHIRDRLRPQPAHREAPLVQSAPDARRSARDVPRATSGDTPLAATGAQAGRHDRGEDR